MRVSALSVIAAVVVSVAGIGCGGRGDDTASGGGNRTVKVDMVDTAFKPNKIEVDKGDTVHFLFDNKGKLDHDAVIGDQAAQAEHEQEMRALEADGHGIEHRGESSAITVKPGEHGELTSSFDRPGTTEIGCHEVGHYDAGMKVTVKVI
jgi:uncharacterized cupredoxin-like copper-binding protein